MFENKWAIACWLCLCIAGGAMWSTNPIAGVSLSLAAMFYYWDRLDLR